MAPDGRAARRPLARFGRPAGVGPGRTYYTGVDIGSYPIDIGRGSGTFPVRTQSFASPTGQGVLEIRPQDMRGLVVIFNDESVLRLDEDDLSAPVVRIDVTQYLVAGINQVRYVPLDRNAVATVVVIVD